MSVMFKAVAKTQPGVAGGGQIKYYASIVRDREVNLRGFAEEIAGKCTLNTGDVFAVLELFQQQLNYHLESGRPVKLGDLGTFSPAIGSTGSDAPADVRQTSITRYKVNFRPSALLADRMSRVKFEKVSDAYSEPDVV